MAYNHGIRVQENPTSMAAPEVNSSAIPVVFGTAPINMAVDPANATNKLFLCNTFEEAKAAVGYSGDFKNYTLCQCMDAFFKMFGVGPVILCNVLDPATHRVEYTETVNVVNNQATTTSEGIILSTLALESDGRTLVLDTDYTLKFDENGYVRITTLTEVAATIELSGFKLDPSKVTETDIIGSVDVLTGAETGIELVRKVYPLFNVAPGLLMAPGWSNKPTVALALAAKCEKISGVFQSECVIDIDTTIVKKHSDVEAFKTDNGYTSKHMICLWPKVQYAGKQFDYSAVYGAMVAYTDFMNDNVPYFPSNQALGVDATVLADGTQIVLDTIQANELNAVGVVTAVNVGGFKSWGNNTACYPIVTDPKDRWINCRRFFSWWGNRFIIAYMEKVDNPADYRLIESIVDSENVRGNSLTSQGKCAGIRMEYNEADNPIENVMNGKIVFKQHLAPYTPAEDILNILEFDITMIEAALGGE